VSNERDALRNQLTTWYMLLDQRTQGFFEAVYAKAPEAVSPEPAQNSGETYTDPQLH
jgi:hypothetical protein